MVKSESQKEAQKKYYEKIKDTDNYKESIKKAQKKYYEKNKEGLINDYNNKIKHCEICDIDIKINYYYLHTKTKKHLEKI